MATITNEYPALINTVFAGDRSVTRNILFVIGGSLALWLSAKIQIPFYPVPITMQTFVMLAIGMAFGWRLGGATLLLYLAEGAVGLPVFAGTPEKGIGLAYMAGPTGGYLLGQLMAVAAVGWLAERGWDRRPSTTALAVFIGSLIIYVPVLLWLGSVLGWDKPILTYGFTPFVLGDIANLILAALLLSAIWRMTGRKPLES